MLELPIRRRCLPLPLASVRPRWFPGSVWLARLDAGLDGPSLVQPSSSSSSSSCDSSSLGHTGMDPACTKADYLTDASTPSFCWPLCEMGYWTRWTLLDVIYQQGFCLPSWGLQRQQLPALVRMLLLEAILSKILWCSCLHLTCGGRGQVHRN